MKITIIRHTIFMATAMLFFCNNSIGQNDRTVLKDKLRFFYFATPNDTTAAPVILDNNAISSGTESGAFWTNNNMRRGQALVRALLRDGQNGGDGSLQYLAAKIVKVINKPVQVFMYDDVTALNSAAKTKWGMCEDSQAATFRAWPCANNQSTSDDFTQAVYRCLGQTAPARTDGTWAGYMHLGAHHMNANQLSWTKGTFIHELVHTQDRSDSRNHLFWVNGSNFRYGLDGSHYSTEAVPNLAMSYAEGIANTITLLYEGNTANQRFNWFSSNGNYHVEINPNPVGTGTGNLHRCRVASTPSPDAWLYQQMVAAGNTERRRVTVTNGGVTTTYAEFRIRDVQPKFIIHSEFILALIFSEYARHISTGTFMQALRTSNNQLFRVSASGIAILFENMCRAGLPSGVSVDDLNRMSVAGPQKYFLPLAFADYFTAYRSTNKRQFKAIFENMLPDAWINAYWDNARTTVRTTVPMPATPQWSNLTDIAIALGINQSTPD